MDRVFFSLLFFFNKFGPIPMWVEMRFKSDFENVPLGLTDTEATVSQKPIYKLTTGLPRNVS